MQNKDKNKDKIIRYDSGEIHYAERTPEGYLKIFATVTRTGVFTYLNADGSLRRELRHPDDVFKQDSIKTLKMIPVTNDHPAARKITADNVKEYSVGNTGENVAINGRYIDLSFVIQDQSGIDAVMNGKRELSLGYSLVLIEEDGEYGGERYDFRQTEIEYNHLAIVAQARAGKEARIVLDSADAIQIVEKQKPKTVHNVDNKENKMEVEVRLDNGCKYSVPQEVAAELTNLKSVNKDLSEKSIELKKNCDAYEAERDSLKADLEKEKGKNNDADIQEAVKKRTALVAKATPRMDAEDLKKIADMSEKDIKIAVIKNDNKNANLDGKSDDYIQALFDLACEKEVNSDSANISSQRQATGSSNLDSSNEDSQENARKRYLDSLKGGWKAQK